MNNILITGASGLLGGNLCYLFSTHAYRVTAAVNEHQICIPGVEAVNIHEISGLRSPVDVVIHCAAKTNVDECEKNPAEAYTANVELTQTMVDFANRRAALFIHISTDAVYGEGPEKKLENFPLEPVNVYASTKLMAEKTVEANAHRYYILRTNLFGFNILEKYSLSEWILFNLAEGRRINGFFDVHFSPVFVNDVFGIIERMIRSASHINNVFNIGSTNGISKFDFACTIARKFGLDQGLVTPMSVLDFDFAAKRPLNMVMDCSKFQSSFSYLLAPVEAGIDRFEEAYRGGYHSKLRSFNPSQYVNR